MPEKTSENGRKYDIDGRSLVWHPEDDEGVAGNLPDIRIPLRIKMKLVLAMSDKTMDSAVMSEMLAAIIPNQTEATGEMDVNDFQDMFVTWQTEYNTLTGASLGESEGSSKSSGSTVEQSSTTSVPVST